ncbi:MAG TPA: dolichyl-phosphate beta-glucosyltransferase [Blastocatellia bacterium]|nr:dolichyl-phosphate beta-glucosyltransferase [Blastocatellia bacterium]
MKPALSIVIPAYNEEGRIRPTLEKILDFASSRTLSTEVVVVDDGSTDDTSGVVADMESRYRSAGVNLRVLVNTPNRGKGYSVKRGVFESLGEIVLFTDADLSSPISEAPKLIDPIARGEADFVFGSRALNRELIGVRQPLYRDFGGRIFNLFVKTIAGLKFKDTQCGFKAFRREAALPVFALQQVERFGFDPEILYIAKKRRLKLLEAPVVWNDVAGTRISYFRDSAAMFADLLLIRWNDLRGRYNLPDDWVAPSSADEATLMGRGKR